MIKIKGLRKHGRGYQTFCRVAGEFRSATWPLDTPIAEMTAWLTHQHGDQRRASRPFNGHVRAPQRKGWLSVPELAEELRFTVTAPTDPDEACRAWLRRHHIVGVKRGRTILVSSVDVENALRKASA